MRLLNKQLRKTLNKPSSILVMTCDHLQRPTLSLVDLLSSIATHPPNALAITSPGASSLSISSPTKPVMAYQRRLLKETQKLLDLASTPGLEFSYDNDISDWTVKMSLKNKIYDPEIQYRLRIKTTDQYPLEPPMVMFIGEHIPIHPHIYSNGHICLNILGDGWTPVQTIESIALSIHSMLESNTREGKYGLLFC